jgi:hypothetical protein
MAEFKNLLSRFTSELDSQTHSLEEATASDTFGNQRPWQVRRNGQVQPDSKQQASAASMLQATTGSLFRELGSLNEALDECYNFVGISNSAGAGSSTPLTNLVARAHEIASSNERVLSRAEELASHLGPFTARTNEFSLSLSSCSDQGKLVTRSPALV